MESFNAEVFKTLPKESKSRLPPKQTLNMTDSIQKKLRILRAYVDRLGQDEEPVSSISLPQIKEADYTSIRLATEQKKWARDYSKGGASISKSEVYGVCVAFAMENSERFDEYLSSLQIEAVESEILDEDSTTTEDSSEQTDSSDEAPEDSGVSTEQTGDPTEDKSTPQPEQGSQPTQSPGTAEQTTNQSLVPDESPTQEQNESRDDNPW